MNVPTQPAKHATNKSLLKKMWHVSQHQENRANELSKRRSGYRGGLCLAFELRRPYDADPPGGRVGFRWTSPLNPCHVPSDATVTTPAPLASCIRNTNIASGFAVALNAMVSKAITTVLLAELSPANWMELVTSSVVYGNDLKLPSPSHTGASPRPGPRLIKSSVYITKSRHTPMRIALLTLACAVR